MFNFNTLNIITSFLVVCLILLKADLIYFLVSLSIYVGIVLCGSFFIRYNFFLKSVNAIPNRENCIAITFDDGPSPITMEVLEVLDKWKAKATFFCIGSQVEKYPEILKKIHLDGHLIGNHTQTHSNIFPLFGTKK